MKLSIQEGSTNYAAKVVTITNVLPIDGKDLIQKTTVFGNNVIISKSAKVGDKCIYFCSGTKLSPYYCEYNNLYDQSNLNIDTTKKGYISSKCRVKAIKLAGIISDGILMPIDSLHITFNGELKEGDEFTHIDNTLICEKYFVPVRNSGTGQPKKEPKLRLETLMIPNQFRFHHDTPHLGKNLGKMDTKAGIVITSKLHGSSCILSKVKILRKLTLIDKIARFFGAKIVESEYAGVYSSGKPKSNLVKGIETRWENGGESFYKDNIWKKAYDDYKYALEDGISLYGELCNESIQKGYDYSKIRPDGKDYGFFIYRITRTNDSGLVDEFSFDQIEQYCQKYGLNTVPLHFKGSLHNYFFRDGEYPFNEDISLEYAIQNKLIDYLSEAYLEKKCSLCRNDVWAEGICVRVDIPYSVFKLKSKNFTLAEDKLLEQEVSNIEDEQ